MTLSGQSRTQQSFQCHHHHWTVLSLLPGWTLTFSYKFKDTRFKKLICTKEIKKIIYNKLVLKNTKITSVTSVMPTTWDIYTCRESSSSVVCTAVLHPDEQTAAISHTDRCVQNIHMLNTAVVFAHINAGYNSFLLWLKVCLKQANIKFTKIHNSSGIYDLTIKKPKMYNYKKQGTILAMQDLNWKLRENAI